MASVIAGDDDLQYHGGVLAINDGRSNLTNHIMQCKACNHFDSSARDLSALVYQKPLRS